MNGNRVLSRLSTVAATGTMAVLLHPLAAAAQWSASGSGSAAAAATTMPTGSAPTATAGGSSVRVSWSAVTLGSGAPVGGYVINRYNAINGSPTTVGPGCSGIVTTTTCTELTVPSGTWIYTDTPVEASWSGMESPPSSQVLIP